MSHKCGNVPCRHIVITNNSCDESVTVTQPLIGTVEVTAIGPQGPRGFSFPYTGSADITGSLTITGSFNHSGAYFINHLVITHSDDSTYQVEDTEYIMFNTWDGGNGKADIFLPPSTENEGRLLRFKSDSTISQQHSITLNPYSGDSATIDGDLTVNFNRSYDGITLLCHGANWYIIQRKSK
jgi:hypothetical protein